VSAPSADKAQEHIMTATASVEDFASELRQAAETASAWPFEEARKIIERLKRKPKDEVLFETGYGPSGLPHIGTCSPTTASRRG
jgi:lysyl-tRNA synthetase class 1